MFDKIITALLSAIAVFCVVALGSLPFVISADIKERRAFEAACEDKGGTAVELRYDRICLPAGAVIPVGVE